MKKYSILIVEPFYGGSHKLWLKGLKTNSAHNVDCLTLPDRHWKWRMHGGAITLAREFIAQGLEPDLVIFSDMLDVTTFLALTGYSGPSAIYFHENQLTYPWSKIDREKNRKQHYEFINYSSALSVNKCWFNSQYHMKSFLNSLSPFLKQFPDFQNLESISEIGKKSSVLQLGLDLPELDRIAPKNSIPTILWNHRWEYDKEPEEFFSLINKLKERQIDFKLIILGESFEVIPDCFIEAEEKFTKEILHFGYCESKSEYWHLLSQSDFLPVTSKQDFFGISVAEAIHAGCTPILPDRLAFPELVPDSLHAKYFYDGSSKGLLDKMTAVIADERQIDQDLIDFIGRFNWPLMARQYDLELGSLIESA